MKTSHFSQPRYNGIVVKDTNCLCVEIGSRLDFDFGKSTPKTLSLGKIL
jgi:hypothetical protein